MHCAFNALRYGIKDKMKEDIRVSVEQWGSNLRPSPVLIAVAGVDLLLDGAKSKIVELNNNPAMPQPHKHMSDRYREHLIEMVHDVISLGMGCCDDCEKFDMIW